MPMFMKTNLFKSIIKFNYVVHLNIKSRERKLPHLFKKFYFCKKRFFANFVALYYIYGKHCT